MSNSEIIQLVGLGIFGLGVIFLLVALLVSNQGKQKAARCTRQTWGEVYGYDARGNGVYFPKVVFEVRGKEYETRLNYRNHMIKSSSRYRDAEVVGDPLSTTLRIQRNAHFSSNPVEDVFPPGTELKVFYNPANPKENYVERYAGSLFPLIFTICGANSIAVAALFYFVLA